MGISGWVLLMAATAFANDTGPPKHAVWTSSVGGVLNVAHGQARTGLRTEHALLLPMFLQGRADLTFFPLALDSSVVNQSRVGHASAGVHIPFRTSGRLIRMVRYESDGIRRTRYGVRSQYRRVGYHSLGALVGYAGQSRLETRPDATATRVVATGTHVFAPPWSKRQPESGPTPVKATFSWQVGALLGEEGPGRVIELSYATGPLRTAVAHQSGRDGSFTMVEIGAQLQRAKDVVFVPVAER